MISEESCDTEDWRNYAMHHSNQLHVTYTQKTVILNCNILSVYYGFYWIFDQINAASLSRFFFFFKNIKHLTNPKLLNGILPEKHGDAMHLISVYKDEEM